MFGCFLERNGKTVRYSVKNKDLQLILLNFFSVEDLERNDGSAERPYLMPESLRKVLNKKNKTQPAE